jgi:AhpD family alkylhydroperoxidase
MTQRLDFFRASPNMLKKFFEFSMAVKAGSIQQSILDLVNIRASQINGCAFCLDIHVKEATLHNERELRLHHVAIWRESPLFDERERASLEWAETLTKIPEHGVTDEMYARVRAQFSEQEVSDLTYAIMTINAWNRANVAFRTVPGTRDAELGLSKAGLN